MRPKTFITVVALALIAFLIVAGTLDHRINYTAVAVGLSTLLGVVWGKKDNDK